MIGQVTRHLHYANLRKSGTVQNLLCYLICRNSPRRYHFTILCISGFYLGRGNQADYCCQNHQYIRRIIKPVHSIPPSFHSMPSTTCSTVIARFVTLYSLQGCRISSFTLRVGMQQALFHVIQFLRQVHIHLIRVNQTSCLNP